MTSMLGTVQLEQITKWLTAAGAAIGAGWLLLRYLMRLVSWANGKRAQAVKFLARLSRAVDEILPNGGSSLSDSVRRQERELAEIRGLVTTQIRLTAINSARWRALHQDHENGIFDTDAEGLITWTNRTLVWMTGRDTLELVGNGWLLAVVESEREGAWDEWQACLAQRRDFERMLTFERYDPQARRSVRLSVHVRASAILDDRGQVAGLTGIVSPRGVAEQQPLTPPAP